MRSLRSSPWEPELEPLRSRRETRRARMPRTLTMILTLGLLGCSGETSRVVKPPEVSEAAVVEALLRHVFPDQVARGSAIVIERDLSMHLEMMTDDGDLGTYRDELIREARSLEERLVEAVRDLCDRNGGKNSIDRLGTIGLDHVVIGDEELTAMFQTDGWDGWDEFRRRYPGSPAMVTLSRPGFSADGSLALIYLGWSSDWECGEGRLYVLERRGEDWVTTETSIGPSWIS